MPTCGTFACGPAGRVAEETLGLRVDEVRHPTGRGLGAGFRCVHGPGALGPWGHGDKGRVVLPGHNRIDTGATGREGAGLNPRPTKGNMSLINKAKVRQLSLAIAAETRGGKFTRVSAGFLDRIEAKVRNVVAQEIHAHPSVGRTLK